jgi:hypothetical protein
MDKNISKLWLSRGQRCLIASLLFPIFLAAAGAKGAATVEDELDQAAVGKFAVPILGYDDKRGWQYGVAGFLYTDKDPGINAGFVAISNLKDFHSIGFSYDQRGTGSWSYALSLQAEKNFDNYYGEGDLTSASNHVYISETLFEAKPSLLYRLVSHLRVGTFVDFRAREETGTRYFPNEASSSPGLHIEWDTRDKLINTHRGDFFQLDISRNTGTMGFSQLSFDLRRFNRLRRHLTLGSRIIGGTSFGAEPSYLFSYRLGGLYLLRGYKDNRFRGSEFFLAQEELRWLLTKWLSVNVSLDTGDIREEAYHQLKLSGQAGLRLGLPPNWGQKMRVDLGVGIDQHTFQIQFGEIF